MNNTDNRFFPNIIKNFYNGLMATIYLITGKKSKIKDLYVVSQEDAFLENDTNNAFVNRTEQMKKEHEKMIQTEKISFKYKACDKNGKIIKSSFDAYNIEQAKNFLTQEGLDVLEIAPKTKYDVDITFGKPLSVSELAFALTQLATYIRAGISLIDSVRILAKQTPNNSKRKIYELIVYDLLAGEDFSDALARQPKVFPKLLVNMVKSSELTGDLPNVLEDMADYYTSIDKTRKEIKSAMSYPTVVFIFSILVVAFVLIWVVPQYQSMFAGYGVSLPKITLITLSFSNFLQEKAWVILIVIILILILYLYLFNNVRSFRYTMQYAMLHVPVVKNIIMYSEIAMFTKTFSSLLNHGVHITDSMDVLIKVSDNEVYRRIIEKTVRNLNAGGKISDAFKDNWAIPIVAYEMIVTGENTGKLGIMMEKVYQYYDGLHTNAVTSIKSLIEPILIIFLAGSVGLIILSIILPMFNMYQALA